MSTLTYQETRTFAEYNLRVEDGDRIAIIRDGEVIGLLYIDHNETMLASKDIKLLE